MISDLLMPPTEVERAVHALRERHYDVVLLHIVGPSELEPESSSSHVLFQDVESGLKHPVRLTPAALARYRSALGGHLDALAAIARRAHARYARARTDSPVSDFITRDLLRLGVVRPKSAHHRSRPESASPT